VELPEAVECVTIDVAWTRQRHILPSARRILAPGADVIGLIKPHYEADRALLRRGLLPEEHLDMVLDQVKADIAAAGFRLAGLTRSPIKGARGNTEFLAHLLAEDPVSTPCSVVA